MCLCHAPPVCVLYMQGVEALWSLNLASSMASRDFYDWCGHRGWGPWYFLGYVCPVDHVFHRFLKTNSHLSTQKDWHILQSHQVKRLAILGSFSFKGKPKNGGMDVPGAFNNNIMYRRRSTDVTFRISFLCQLHFSEASLSCVSQFHPSYIFCLLRICVVP